MKSKTIFDKSLRRALKICNEQGKLEVFTKEKLVVRKDL